MDTLATIARRRAVVTTISDLIVAAAGGKRLRVAVGCTHPDQTGFVEHLTRALHARGPPCHCLAPKPNPITTDGCPPASSPAVAVTTSGAPGPDEEDLCRINIQLRTPTPVPVSVASAHDEPDGQALSSVGGDEPDIIVDYLEPGGPTRPHPAGPHAAAPPPLIVPARNLIGGCVRHDHHRLTRLGRPRRRSAATPNRRA